MLELVEGGYIIGSSELVFGVEASDESGCVVSHMYSTGIVKQVITAKSTCKRGYIGNIINP
jgi:hypothetical protein